MSATILLFALHANSPRQPRKRRKKVVGSDGAFSDILDFCSKLPGRLGQSAAHTANRSAVAVDKSCDSIIGEIVQNHPIGEYHTGEGASYARACQALSADDAVDSGNSCAQDARMSAPRKLKPSPSAPTFLASWRRFRGEMKQEEMAELIDKDRTTYSRLERGEINYTQETLEACARALDCEPWQLLGQDPLDVRWADRLLNSLDPESRRQLIRVAKEIKE